LAAILAALGLGAFYAHTGPRRPSMVWFRLGSADADAILAGEYWRVVTALTLHADAGHVFANAASCALFVGLLCRTVGPGIAVWLVLVAGALGNGATALAYGTHHSAVGASTGIFGAIGALAGLQFASRQRGARPRPWLPLAAGLALLAMLGSSPDADVAAHFFGFAAGAGAGLALGVRPVALPGTPGQSLLSLAAAVAIVACWGLAFGRLSISTGGPSSLG
jgi:membrane associated rhomboid family serine protease